MVERLPVYTRAPSDLFDWAGQLLVAKGQYITPDLALSFRDAHIVTVYALPPARIPPGVLEETDARYIEPNVPLRFSVYDADGNCLAREWSRPSEREIDALRARPKVYRVRPGAAGQAERFQAACSSRVREHLDAQIATGPSRLRVRSSGIAISRTSRRFTGRPAPRGSLAAFESSYRQLAAQLASMWDHLAAGGCVWGTDLTRFVGEVLDHFMAEREIMAALAAAGVGGPEYPEHCLATAVYCLSMAWQLDYNRRQALDLAAAALFHDIGHVMLPKTLLDAERALSKEERRMIFRHVEYALFLFGRIEWDSDDFRLAIYQHHERGIGAGYPTGYKSGKIHEYACVLAAADVFHALISKRPHRKPYLRSDAMNRMLKMGGIGLLDARIVMVFAEQLSLYPIGSCVALSNGEVARVLAPSRELTRPWVGTVLEPDGARAAEPRIRDLSKLPGIVIRGELPAIDDPLLGF